MTQEANAVAEAVPRAALPAVGERGVAVQAARRTHTPGRSVAVANASSRTSWPFSGVTAATHSSASPASVPGNRGGVDAGLGDVHPVGGSAWSSVRRWRVHELVVTTRAARGRRARDRTRAVTAGAERHVHEHDLPQPARLRHEHRRGGGRDEPVEQHDGTVGDPPTRTRQSGCSAAPARPGAGHGVLVTVQPSAASPPQTRRS